uniref:MULE transposase domain-containing protein n=1 Tax=Brassica oleracea TaxID=3712 RepID=A0A3P6FFZ7_BRAOL|nr:unnamed protein product [Brassica oleracea]
MAIFRYSHWLLGSWMRKIYLLGNGFSQNWLVVYLMTKPLVIVSDRHTRPLKVACDKVFPWATRGICYYHLQDNIVKKFKGNISCTW